MNSFLKQIEDALNDVPERITAQCFNNGCTNQAVTTILIPYGGYRVAICQDCINEARS